MTKRINELRRAPGASVWQRNYYEHVIRNEKFLNAIRCYIENNPALWNKDAENQDRDRSSSSGTVVADFPEGIPL